MSPERIDLGAFVRELVGPGETSWNHRGLPEGVRPGAGLWTACALVIAGALLCKTALRER